MPKKDVIGIVAGSYHCMRDLGIFNLSSLVSTDRGRGLVLYKLAYSLMIGRLMVDSPIRSQCGDNILIQHRDTQFRFVR